LQVIPSVRRTVRTHMTGQSRADGRPFFRSRMLWAALLAGVASVLGNAAFNCPTCGWDPDGARWYETLLVAGVPLILTPIGVLIVLLRVVLRWNGSALLEGAGATAALALPWVYWSLGPVFAGVCAIGISSAVGIPLWLYHRSLRDQQPKPGEQGRDGSKGAAEQGVAADNLQGIQR